MPVLFSGLPKDIILEVSNHLTLPDPIHLLLTCSSVYHSLENQRSFWISILTTTRSLSTIACPKHADLAQYSLASLKDLVFSWLKLQDNWNLPAPRLKHPVTSTSLSVPADIISIVQGTDILLLHPRDSGEVVCWDVKMAAPFPLPSIKTGGRIDGVSAPSESYGICSIAILTMEETAPHTARRHVITIKHENRKALTFESVSCQVSIPQGSHFASLFVTQDLVGSVSVEELQEHCTISTSNISSCEALEPSINLLKLHRPVSSIHDLMVSFAYEGHLYNLLEDGVSVQIQHISRKSLASGHCEESTFSTSDNLSPSKAREPFCYILPSTPYYGVGAAFVRYIDDRSFSTITLTFLPTTPTHVPSAPLAFNLPCPTQYIPGKLVSMSLLWMDHSGFNIAVVVDTDHGDPALMLVRYHPETASTSAHQLSVPDAIHLYRLRSVCIDDTAGAVYLVDHLGVFWMLRYV
ncbi:hypothetical protein DFH07DRAFT_775187 [Mycena maculata]|uniref:F-box domain-containing protein n=1 Tax=Mycena maculata TaxID=230809 RepID=A0AAD7IVG1_9AGAR|nr:hypothetical protein DFH07DRAFT_775187 [Mycena maculata]